MELMLWATRMFSTPVKIGRSEWLSCNPLATAMAEMLRELLLVGHQCTAVVGQQKARPATDVTLSEQMVIPGFKSLHLMPQSSWFFPRLGHLLFWEWVVWGLPSWTHANAPPLPFHKWLIFSVWRTAFLYVELACLHWSARFFPSSFQWQMS